MRVGVLGGGLVGLVGASSCRKHECEVLELDAEIGGHCRTLHATAADLLPERRFP